MDEFDEVPDLYGKLNLLIKHGLFTDWNALGSFFGNVRGKTAMGWGFENGRQRRNHVPVKHQQKFRELFEKSLPASYGPAHLDALILGPTDRLDLALKIREWKNLNELIDEEGNSGAARLFVSDDASLGAIRFDQGAAPESHFTVPRNRDFRIEFATAFFGETVSAFYRLSNIWLPCPASIDANAGIVHLPGLSADGKPSFMSEDEATGRYRFVVMQLRHSLPEFIVRAVRQDTVLDALTLQDVIGFYGLQKSTERRLFYADIDIVESPAHKSNADENPVSA